MGIPFSGPGGMPNPMDPGIYSGNGQWQPGQQPGAGNGGPWDALNGGQGGPNDMMFGLGGATPQGGMLTGLLSGGNTPQMRGFGIQEPPPFQQYQSPLGLTAMQADPYAGTRGQGGANGMTQTPTGWDFTGPGVAEQWQQQNQGRFLQPTNQQQFYDSAAGQLSQNLDPYYNNAERRATEAINSQMGARGLFNSSAAAGQNAEAIMNLEAEKANREGQYGLQRAGLLGNLAGGADQANLSNLGAGFSAAQGAEDMRRQRGQDYFNNLMATSLPIMSMAGNTYGQMIGSDLDLMNQGMMAEMGLAGEAQSAQQRQDETARSDTERTAGLFGNVLGGMMGGK